MCDICGGDHDSLSPEELEARLDKMRADIQAVVKSGRVQLMSVMSAGVSPPWTYSIGMAERGLPDVIVMGLRSEVAHILVQQVCEYLTGAPDNVGECELGHLYEGAIVDAAGQEHPVMLASVQPSAAAEFMGACTECYGQLGIESRGVVQVLWPDRQFHQWGQPNFEPDIRAAQEWMKFVNPTLGDATPAMAAG